MKIATRKVDHLVYCVPNLEEAVNWFEEQTGVRPVIGGRHLTKGTKNALVNLGNKCYLELIAADHENTDFSGNRWMGVDLIEAPTMSRWSLKSEHLENDSHILKCHNKEMGVVESGQRQTTTGETLQWQMTLPLATPEVEIAPFFTDWQKSDVHPTDNLPELCKLISLTFYHPQPTALTTLFKELSLQTEIVSLQNAQVRTKIKTPKGLLILT